MEKSKCYEKIHKKGHKQVLRNYLPVSILPICGKIFQHLIYNNLFEFFIENDLISSNQSNFKQGDSYIYQLLSMKFINRLTTVLRLEVLFVIPSKLLKKFGTKVLFLNKNKMGWPVIDFLKERQQRIILNGQHSMWSNISAGVPQGSIPGPLLFLIHINNLSDNSNSNPKLFPDDTSFFFGCAWYQPIRN